MNLGEACFSLFSLRRNSSDMLGSLDFFFSSKSTTQTICSQTPTSQLHTTFKYKITKCVGKSRQPSKPASGSDKWALCRLGVLKQRVRACNCSKACSWRVPIWRDELYYLNKPWSHGNAKWFPYGFPVSGVQELQRAPGVWLDMGILYALFLDTLDHTPVESIVIEISIIEILNVKQVIFVN